MNNKGSFPLPPFWPNPDLPGLSQNYALGPKRALCPKWGSLDLHPPYRNIKSRLLAKCPQQRTALGTDLLVLGTLNFQK